MCLFFIYGCKKKKKKKIKYLMNYDCLDKKKNEFPNQLNPLHSSYFVYFNVEFLLIMFCYFSLFLFIFLCFVCFYYFVCFFNILFHCQDYMRSRYCSEASLPTRTRSYGTIAYPFRYHPQVGFGIS